MLKTKRKFGWIAGCVALLLLLVACGGPPKDLDEQVKGLENAIKAERTYLDTARKTYDDKLNQERFSFLKDYSINERHADSFDKAQAKIDEAEKARTERVKKIADNYKDERRAELETAIGDVNRLVNEAWVLREEPAAWADKILDAKSNAAATVQRAEKTVGDTAGQFTTLQQTTTAATTSFPTQDEAIKRKFEPFAAWNATSATAFSDIQTELKKPNPNYTIVANNAQKIQDNHASMLSEGPKYQATIGELSTSETHTLLDIQVDSEIEIGRTSWNESSDSDTDIDYDYPPVPVDTETANYFAQFAPDTKLATVGFWGAFNTEGNVDRGQWDKLHIDPKKDFPNGHDYADLYMGAVEDTYCHKQLVLVNGKPDTSGRPNPADNYCSKYDSDADMAKGIYWVDSDELSSEYIGMDNYSKPYGDFADQANNEATPPGMAYVGDPNYGQWQNDNNGNSFWVFYGQYRLFSDLIGGPNPYHYRSEYDTWNRDYRRKDEPYYAASGNVPRYGAHSPMTGARFPNSSYTKSGLQDATVRNAGPVSRGGGPGGGGK
jgi:hypothetical protein